MVHLGVRVSSTTKEELQEVVDEHDKFINESDAVRYAVRRMLESRGRSDE